MNSRTEITGRQPAVRQTTADFSESDRAALILRLQKIAAYMGETARLILQQLSQTAMLVYDEGSPNLFLLAAMHYGDMNRWVDIADMMEVESPILTGVVTVKIPLERSNRGSGETPRSSRIGTSVGTGA